MKSPAPREMFQDCFVVKDLQQSIKEWVQFQKAGPFYILHGGFEVDKLYRGNQCSDTYTGAVGFRGDLIIELLQPINDAPSIFREVLGEERSKFHHIHHLRELTPSQYDQEIEDYTALGYGQAYSARVPRMGRAAFMDTYRDLGYFVELMETPPAVFDALEMMRTVHKSWNGTDPVRTFPPIFNN